MDKEDVVHIHNRILHKHKKKYTSIQIISFVATGMALEMIMLSEVSQRESQISYDITYMWNLKKEKKVKLLSHVQLCATPWTVAYHAPPSMEFSRQEYWSGLPFPSPGDLPDPGIKPRSSTLQADALPSEPPGKSKKVQMTLFTKQKSNHIYSKQTYGYQRGKAGRDKPGD